MAVPLIIEYFLALMFLTAFIRLELMDVQSQNTGTESAGLEC